jgi:hypothetical protein
LELSILLQRGVLEPSYYADSRAEKQSAGKYRSRQKRPVRNERRQNHQTGLNHRLAEFTAALEIQPD